MPINRTLVYINRFFKIEHSNLSNQLCYIKSFLTLQSEGLNAKVRDKVEHELKMESYRIYKVEMVCDTLANS